MKKLGMVICYNLGHPLISTLQRGNFQIFPNYLEPAAPGAPRVRIKGLWFMNQESICWSHKPKICKTSIFHKSFFLKYDNFKTIST